MARQAAINTADDMRWLREVHLPRFPTKYKSAIIVGNEDYPDRIEVYERRDPRITDVPVVFKADEDGVFKETSKAHHATKKTPPAQLQREIDEVLAGTQLPNKGCKLTREERALLIAIERGGPHGSVSMRGLDKAAKGLIAKGLGLSIGRIGGGYFINSTVKGSACLGIDWDNGPRPRYDEHKGEYAIEASGTFEAS
jgi:hypothetical protein